MEPKDTTMDWDKWCEEKKVHPAYQLDKTLFKEGLRHQAEISFPKGEKQGIQKGREEVVEFVEGYGFMSDMVADIPLDGDYYQFRIPLQDWQAFLKERGLEK